MQTPCSNSRPELPVTGRHIAALLPEEKNRRVLIHGTICVLGGLLFVLPVLVLAHASVEEVEAELRRDERYVELTDRIAPVFNLQDAEGSAVRLEDFRGKVVILNFLYARREESCSLHSAKLAAVQRLLAAPPSVEDIQFVTIATDTEDAAGTAERMRAHGARYGLDPASWVFLHGGPGREEVGLRLAKAYGLEFVPTPDGEQMHAVVTHLIDAEGRLRARYHGLRFAPVNLTLHAAALAHGTHHEASEGTRRSALASLKDHWARVVIGLVSLAVLAAMGLPYVRGREGRGATEGQAPASRAEGKVP